MTQNSSAQRSDSRLKMPSDFRNHVTDHVSINHESYLIEHLKSHKISQSQNQKRNGMQQINNSRDGTSYTRAQLLAQQMMQQSDP